MDTIKLTPAQVILLRGIAKRIASTDSAALISNIPEEATDAYAVGVSDGEALLARRLLSAQVRA